jgi:hypothetical protein
MLQFVAADGHCFFTAFAAWLNRHRSLQGVRALTMASVRRAAVQEMRGERKHLYQRMWYSEHISNGRRVLEGALTPGLLRQWETYLQEMEVGRGGSAGHWLIGGVAWQDSAVLHATEMAYKVRTVDCTVVLEAHGIPRVHMKWSARDHSLVPVKKEWPPLYMWHLGTHWEPLARIDPTAPLGLCEDANEDLIFPGFASVFKAGHESACEVVQAAGAKGAVAGAKGVIYMAGVSFAFWRVLLSVNVEYARARLSVRRRKAPRF